MLADGGQGGGDGAADHDGEAAGQKQGDDARQGDAGCVHGGVRVVFSRIVGFAGRVDQYRVFMG